MLKVSVGLVEGGLVMPLTVKVKFCAGIVEVEALIFVKVIELSILL